MTMKQMNSKMHSFDPRKVAYYEKENWAAYYQKQWLRLLRVSVGMVRAGFVLSMWQAIRGAYLVARAEIAAAPFPNNDVPLAEAYMERFYSYIKRIHGESFDPAEAARLDVNWWVVHRRLFGQSENREVIDALADLYAAVYSTDRALVYQAAYHRAQAMIYSDRWVNEGRHEPNPLLEQVEAELYLSYASLREAVSGELQAVSSKRLAVGSKQ
jgi:hypothetical protein